MTSSYLIRVIEQRLIVSSDLNGLTEREKKVTVTIQIKKTKSFEEKYDACLIFLSYLGIESFDVGF